MICNHCGKQGGRKYPPGAEEQNAPYVSLCQKCTDRFVGVAATLKPVAQIAEAVRKYGAAGLSVPAAVKYAEANDVPTKPFVFPTWSPPVTKQHIHEGDGPPRTAKGRYNELYDAVKADFLALRREIAIQPGDPVTWADVDNLVKVYAETSALLETIKLRKGSNNE